MYQKVNYFSQWHILVVNFLIDNQLFMLNFSAYWYKIYPYNGIKMSLYSPKRNLIFVSCSRICSWDYSFCCRQQAVVLSNFISKTKQTLVFSENTMRKLYRHYEASSLSVRIFIMDNLNQTLRLADGDFFFESDDCNKTTLEQTL